MAQHENHINCGPQWNAPIHSGCSRLRALLVPYSICTCAHWGVSRAVIGMAELTAIMQEISGIRELAGRKKPSALLEGLARSLAVKIGQLVQWDVACANRLSDAIDSTPLPDPVSLILSDAVDKRTQVIYASFIYKGVRKIE